MNLSARIKLLVIPGFVLAGALCSFLQKTHIWNIRAEQAKIHFDVPGYRHNGDISGLKCRFVFNPLAPEESVITASVDVNTIATDKQMLTNHLKSPEFFDVKRYPEILFASDSVRSAAQGFVAYGKLTMKGITHPVQIPFDFIQTDSVCTAKGDLELNAADYKVGKKYRHDRDLVLISIEVPMTAE